MKHQAQREEEAFGKFCREVVSAARADEEVISAAADSAFLFQRVRARLATDAQTPARSGWRKALFAGAQVSKWVMAATAVAMVIALLALTRSAHQTLPDPPAPVIAETPAGKPSLPLQVADVLPPEAPKGIAKTANVNGTSHSVRHKAVKGEEEELTTEYVPLTYAAYADETDSGHVVRVQVPRTALLALGVPIGAEASTELVKADVIVGDDGLARAIRLVR
jgi:hypothetical protein